MLANPMAQEVFKSPACGDHILRANQRNSTAEVGYFALVLVITVGEEIEIYCQALLNTVL